MKKFIFLSICFFIEHNVTAQDIIRLKSGIEIKAKVTEVNATTVEYKKYGNTNSPIYEEDKVNIDIIQFENGTIEKIGESQNKNTQTSNGTAIQSIQSIISASIAEKDSSNSFSNDSIKILLQEISSKTNATKEENLNNYNKLIEEIAKISQNQQNITTQIEQQTKIINDELIVQKENNNKQSKQLLDSIQNLNKRVKSLSEGGETKWKPRPFGIGFNVTNSNLFSEVADFVFDDRFNIKLNYSILIALSLENLRFEPEFSYLRFKYPFTYDSANVKNEIEYTTEQLNIGVGILPMFQIKKVNVMLGIRINYHEYNFKETTNDKETYKYKISAISLNPCIGAEYVFGNNFSLGAEGLLVIYAKGKASGTGSLENTFSFISTQARVVARVYF